MPFVGQVCSRGVWDQSLPNITFDSYGISNYAYLFDKLVSAYPRGEKGYSEWLNITKKIRTSGKNKKYDCVIGVSGGTDSSFLLHIAKEYNLKPLAVNLDNGWNSDTAVKNIKKMTQSLGIDLETYVVNYEEIKDLIKVYLKAGLSWIDMPTDIAIKSALYKIANREGIKFVLQGNDFRSEGNQPIDWTYGDGKQLKFLHDKFGSVRLKSFPNLTLSNLVYYAFLKRIKRVLPFYYLDYNKKEAQKYLTEKYGWEYYGGHHFENTFTKFVMSYWIFEKFAIDKRKITLSAQILSGEISREFAVHEINESPYRDYNVAEMLYYVSKKLDLTVEQLNNFMKIPNKTYKNYPSYYWIFNGLGKYASPFLKLIFIHKPTSLFKREIIGQ